MEKLHWMYHGWLSSAKLPSLRLCVCCILHMPEQGCCSSDALIRCEQGLCEGRRVRTNAPCFLWCPPNVLQARRKGAKRSHMFEALFFHALPSQRQPRQCPSLLGWNIVCARRAKQSFTLGNNQSDEAPSRTCEEGLKPKKRILNLDCLDLLNCYILLR